MSTEKTIRKIVKDHCNLEISRKQLNKFIHKYNNHLLPITKCIDNIIKDPSDFIDTIYNSPELKLKY